MCICVYCACIEKIFMIKRMGGKDVEGLMVDEKVGHEAKRNMNCFLQLHVTIKE